MDVGKSLNPAIDYGQMYVSIISPPSIIGSSTTYPQRGSFHSGARVGNHRGIPMVTKRRNIYARSRYWPSYILTLYLLMQLIPRRLQNSWFL